MSLYLEHLKNKILEFGVCWSRICSGSVLCGQLLGNNEALITPNSKCKGPFELFQNVKSFISFVIIEPISLKDCYFWNFEQIDLEGNTQAKEAYLNQKLSV